MKRTQRWISFLLALVMLLPLAAFPAVAEEAAPTVFWKGNGFEGETPTADIQSGPVSQQVVEEANGNHALRFDSVGIKGGSYPEDYYVATYGATASKTKFYAVSSYTLESDGTVSGSVTVEGTDYTFTKQSADQNLQLTLTPELTGYALLSGNQVDAFFGCGNVASPVRVKSPAIASTDAEKIAFEAHYYFAKGTKGTFASRARATDNGYVELFGVKASDTTVSVQAHENASITEGSAVIVSTEKWIKITALFDPTAATVTVYVNDVIAFKTKNNSNVTLNTPVSIRANSWDLLQLNRGSRTADAIGGYVMIDDPIIYDGSSLSTEIKASFKDTYENYAPGTQLTTAWGYNAVKPGEIAAYNKVLAEENGNQFVRFPVVYDGTQAINTAGYTNYDKTLMINQPGLTPDNEFMLLDVSYRPHGNETDTAENIELQLRSFTFDLLASNGATLKPRNGTVSDVTEDIIGKSGIYLNLFTINIKSGVITVPSHGLKLTGAAGLVQDEWNDIRYVLNLKSPSALIFVNGELYATVETMVLTGSNWDSCTKGSNLTVPGGNVIIAKGNKQDGAFKKIQNADENYSNVNYIDIDNVSVSAATGEDLLGEFDPTAYNGMITTESTTSIRHFAPYGLRFVSRIDEAKLDELHSLIGTKLLAIDYGTVIVCEADPNAPASDYTVAALEKAGRKYIKVKANYGAYFQFDDDESTTHIAGSVVNIKDEHKNTSYAGIGYVRLVLVTGEEYWIYSESATVSSVDVTAQRVIDATGLSGFKPAAKRAIKTFSQSESLLEIMKEDLKGLNVLALGDSLFAGTDEGTPGCDRASQWVNLLGNQNDWTLTNLGIGGMTVSYTEKNYTGAGHKSSMYDWLFNNINDYRWGSSYNTEDRLYYPGTSYSYNYYYHCGDFTGKTAADVDLILLEGGCNDYGTAIAAPLGTLDSKDPATFLGAWNCVTEKLLADYPNARIVFITTWHLNPQSRPDGLSSIEYSTSINRLYEEVYAENDRVYLIDAGDPNVSGVNMRDNAWKAQYSNDAYHLKNNGMALMAGNMFPRLWESFINTQEEAN